MKNDEDGYPNIEDTIDRLEPEKALLMEYQEAGAEWRNYETLLNQSYYLTAIVLTFFAGAITNLWMNQEIELSIVLLSVASTVFLVLGIAGRAYHERRESASRLRTELEEEIRDLTNSKVPRLQKVIVGDGEVRIDQRPDDSLPGVWERFPLYKITFTVAGLSFFLAIGVVYQQLFIA